MRQLDRYGLQPRNDYGSAKAADVDTEPLLDADGLLVASPLETVHREPHVDQWDRPGLDAATRARLKGPVNIRLVHTTKDTHQTVSQYLSVLSENHGGNPETLAEMLALGWKRCKT